MTPETITLAKQLQREAVDQTESVSDAVSALLSATVSIMEPIYGDEGTLAVLTNLLDTEGAKRRARRAN